ncbi:MAG TPA: hypothetical protein VF725_05340 [Ktedonobacterales bacterium]
MSTSLRLMLLGIALIVFGLAFEGSILNLIMRPIIDNSIAIRWFPDALASIFPLAGLIVAFVGFFKRDQP